MKWNRLPALWGVVAMGSFGAMGCDDDDGGMTGVEEPPAAPTNVQAAAQGMTSIQVSWTAGTNADSYDVTLSTDGEADRTQNGVTTTSVTFTDLTPGKTYFAQVVAVNDVGTSGAATASATTEMEVETVVQVNDDILQNTTWTADKTYVLNQPTFVGSDCGTDGSKTGCVETTLTIEPGTTIVGNTDLPQGIRGAYLIVSRGSKIIADATGADRPPTADEVIVFTSDNPKGQRARGDWGGIIVNGQAPTNAGLEAEGEGDSGFFGGNDDMDDSGIIRGVRIEFAGDDVTPTDQLNGLALQGVGAGTTISYVQIAYNVDDGIEPFGSTVSVDHLVLTGIGDDSVDGTDGYRGFMQFVLAQQRGDDADNGFEISGNGDDPGADPKSTAVVANATMIGSDENVVDGTIAGGQGDVGLLFREGSNYRVYNSIITGFGKGGLCIEDGQTIVNAQNRLAGQTDPDATLSAEGLIVWNNVEAGGADANFASCDDNFSQQDNRDFFDAFANTLADPGFDDSAFDVGTLGNPPDFTLADMPAGYTPFNLSNVTYDDNLVAPADGRRLVDTDYAGAIEPGTALATAWYVGWTIWAEDGSDSRPNSEGM